MAWASTVAVVVPSPATSDVLLATSLTICAPMFSSGFFRSISFATVTPSFVIVGDPYALPMMTLRPLGPSVTLTAFASELTPRRIAWRDASPYVMSLAIVCVLWLRVWSALLVGNSGHARIDSQHVVFLHDQVVHAVEFDVLPGVLAEQDGVARLHVHCDTLALVVHLAGARGDNRAPLRFFFRGIRNDDPADLLFTFFEALNEEPIVKWSDLHG